MTEDVRALLARVDQDFEWLVEFQRDLHAHPEMGFEEYRTAGRVAEEMQRLGLEVRTGILETGVTATLQGARERQAVALRVDMDAFPIEEAEGLPWRSRRPGVAHVCGHDAHTTIGVGVARALAGLKDRLAGTVRFIFQPAEERPRVLEEGERPYLEGVRAMPAAELLIGEGVLDSPPIQAIYGLHLWPWLPAGQVGIEEGPAMAGAANFTASIHGQGSHGAAPHSGVDSIVAVAHVLSMLQTIVSRQTPPAEPLVITVGTIRGGDRRNVIADRVDITGTVRGFSTPLLREVVPERMRAILEGVCRALGATYDLDYYPLILPVVNDGELARRAREAVEAALGPDVVVTWLERAMTSEDFACYAQRVPGLYLKIGCTRPGEELVPLHNRAFRFDEEALRVGTKAAAVTLAARLA
ncbi:MAG: amidohydrolase [Anaerolineae bacterium]|nr:amidohydrolase [Anaerolineae bacterium]